ncbi:MAG: hypothetical protein L0Y56_16255, partial [Nitrospira sp.]|nr:hypothetical protein [Nitrospira sp.]
TYPVQTIIAVLGIALTMAYLMRMFRGLFFGELKPQYAHARDGSPVIDRLPFVLMMGCSILFGLFPSHFIRVIEGGVGPILAKLHTASQMVVQVGGGLF